MSAIDRALRVEVLVAVDRAGDDRAVADQHKAAADDTGGLDLLVVDLFDGGPTCRGASALHAASS